MLLVIIQNRALPRTWRSRKKSRYADVAINILGLRELITSKKRFKREQDKLDLKRLKRLKRQD